MTVLERLLSAVSGVLEVDAATLKLETEAQFVDQWDSLRHLAIITAVEEAFQIQLSMDVVMEIDGIAKLYEAVIESQATRESCAHGL